MTENTEQPDVVLIHGKQVGWVDIENLKKFLDQKCCTDCWLYLETAPVERVERALEEEDRIRVRVTKNPKKSAKAYYEELQQGDRSVEVKRLEEVSDRSMNRGGC
jgi:thymidylate kinase